MAGRPSAPLGLPGHIWDGESERGHSAWTPSPQTRMRPAHAQTRRGRKRHLITMTTCYPPRRFEQSLSHEVLYPRLGGSIAKDLKRTQNLYLPFSKTLKEYLEQDKTCLKFPLFSCPPHLLTPTVLKPLSPPPVPAHISLSVTPFLFQFSIAIARGLSIKAGPPQGVGQWESPSQPSQREARLAPQASGCWKSDAVMSSGC